MTSLAIASGNRMYDIGPLIISKIMKNPNKITTLDLSNIQI